MECNKFCSHGGYCTLERGHEGLHDASGRCRFSDNEVLPRREATAVLATKPGGAFALFCHDLVEDNE